MNNFDKAMGSAVTNASKKGYLVSVLELGAWAGVLATGYLADKLSRKYTIFTGMLY
jgi:MFS family permease